MRSLLFATSALFASAVPVAAQEAEKVPPNLLSPNGGLMIWTVVIFIVLFVILSRFAFKPLTAAVVAREAALEEMITAAKRDRDEAAKLLEEQKRGLDASRAEVQRLIAEGRITGEKLRNEMLEQTKHAQHELIERARIEIDNERKRAIADLRREAVELALAGASKVIERNLDEPTNRRMVESFLASVPIGAARGKG